MNIIDRRKNPKGKSIGNRQRFLKRAKDAIRDAVKKSIQDKSIEDIGSGENISIPTRGIKEPFIHHGKGGTRNRILPGNKEFNVGDRIPRPEGGGGKGSKGSPDGDGEDSFTFVLSRDEYLDIFFEDLELPPMVKESLKEIKKFKTQRAGFTTVGNPSNLNIINTMRQAMGRRIALKRPKSSELNDLKSELFLLENKTNLTTSEKKRKKWLHDEIDRITKKMASVPFIDPIDVRYNAFTKIPKPTTQAVMFAIMDVSGSMGEFEKDLAKRFFMLLYLFLGRRYERIDIVFIRHTHEAKEVNQEEFFYSKETGGTVVSKSLELMKQIIDERYPVDEWNFFGCQCSDGDNWSDDSQVCLKLMNDTIMPLMQYYAYIEIGHPGYEDYFAHRISDLWNTYGIISEQWKTFAMTRVDKPSDIFPVFRELFRRD